MQHGDGVPARSFRYRADEVEVVPAGLIKGEPNLVSTTRFTALTWLPKSLFLQFQRVANIYFLFIAIIVCMPFSTKRWQSKVFPYILVLAWTALKDLYEDSQRRKDNRIENSRICWRFNVQLQEFEQTAWRLLKPGDFVCTLCDEAFPADLLVVSAPDGDAFLSTVNLDGETNLKLRSSPKVFASLQVNVSKSAKTAVPQELASLVSEVCRQELHTRFGPPCADLAEMNALLSLEGKTDSAACDNFAPRGCVLRNTPWLLSIVAYAGKDTKQCLNSAKVSGKVSHMQCLLNRCVYGLLAFLVLTCCYLATAAKSMSANTDWLERFLAYTITLYHVVPISLYVAFEVLKLILGRRIDNDPQMMDKAGTGAKARTADLVEELGQIDFVFSDKTGTLTANDMRFARCAVGDIVFDSFIQDSLGGPVLGREQVKDILSGNKASAQNVLWFFICLSVCHTVQVNDEEFSGPSPDEVALVQGAHSVGVSLKSRKKTELQKEEIVISAPSVGNDHAKAGFRDHIFYILHIIEFTAERKRMSVLCQHEGRIFCITKGADIAVNQLLTSKLGAKEDDQLSFFSRMGLRTLVFASKTIDPSSFASWERQWLTAKGSLESRGERLAECGAVIETDLQLIGISAVEDQLQKGVPSAIAKVKEAGIRLWVLTGDKTETAVDIAHSCNLFSHRMELIFLTNATDLHGALERLVAAKKKVGSDCNCGLVIDGQTLQYILEGQEGAADTFYELAMSSSSCVCTRFSPSQKRRLVDEVRKQGRSITLAIGDGANDVPMILGAHVGIGIRGKEGSQAVQASDIAISQSYPQTEPSDRQWQTVTDSDRQWQTVTDGDRQWQSKAVWLGCSK